MRGYIYDVRQEPRGPQIFISRTHPQFMAKLFSQEVPEIYDGIIEIKAVARDPGSRAKIAVLSHDSSIDPVGACVGMRGSRVQAVVNELQGEKIDIIQWSPDTATFVVNALAPAEVTKVVMDEDDRRIEVVVPDDQLSLAIGRRGQNVRLASQLVGWDIDILTESDESERRIEEMRLRSEHFMETLDVDDVLARICWSPKVSRRPTRSPMCRSRSCPALKGFDEGHRPGAAEPRPRFCRGTGSPDGSKTPGTGRHRRTRRDRGLSPVMLVELGEKEIKTLDDLADLAGDELIEDYRPESYLTLDEANAIIMAARAHWFPDEEPADRGGRGGRGNRLATTSKPARRRSGPWSADSAGQRIGRRRCPSDAALSPGETGDEDALMRFVVGARRPGGARRRRAFAGSRGLGPGAA